MNILALIFPFGSGICDAWNRKIAKDNPAVTKLMLVSFGMLSAVPYFLGWLYLTGVKQMDPGVWVVIFVHGIIIVALNWLLFEAHRLGEMTALGSYFSLTPAFSIPVSWNKKHFLA